MSDMTETESADVLDEIEAAIRSGRSMGLGAWAILNRVQRLATPTPARSEAQWGEPRPDCPRCHGTGTYRLTPDSRLRPCRCGLSERSEAAGGEATGQIIVKHYPVMFTPPGTDENGTPPLVDVLAGLSDEARVQTDGYSYHALGPKTRATLREAVQELASLRQQLAAVEARYDQIAAATDEAVRAGEELARAVLDMDTWGIAGSNFDSAMRLTDIETLNRLRHLASKVIPAAQDDTTGGASDK